MNHFAGLVISFLLLSLVEAAAEPARPTITLDLYGVPLIDVASQLEQQYALHFSIPEPLHAYPVTTSIQSQSVEQAVGQILQGLQYAVVDQKERGLQVFLFGKGEQGELPEPTRYLPVEVEERSRELVIRTDRQGRYMAEGTVNGVATEFLVDTGANWLVLGKAIAEQAGVTAEQPVQVKTASGVAQGYWTKIETLSLGTLHWTDIEAIVLADLESPPALLGMNLLKTVNMDMSGERLLLKQSGN